MLDAIRRWLGATRQERERELQELADSQARETEAVRTLFFDCRRALDEFSNRLTAAEAERDDVQRLLAAAEADRDEARRDRDSHAVRLRAAELERDEVKLLLVLRAEGLRSCRYRLRELIDRHGDVDRRLAEANEAVAGWRQIAGQILRSGGGDGSYKAADDIEPTTESPEDRPATDSGAAEPRPPAKPLPTNQASTASMTIVTPGRRVDLADRTANE